MDKNESKKEFYDLLDKHGLDKSKFLVGYGRKPIKNRNKKRFIYNTTNLKFKGEPEYYVKYFECLDKYLIWQKCHISRTVFSVDAEKIINSTKTVKHIEFINRKAEDVLALSFSDVDKFLKSIKNTEV